MKSNNKSNLSFKSRFLLYIRNKICDLGYYCNNHTEDKAAYNIYLIMVKLFL